MVFWISNVIRFSFSISRFSRKLIFESYFNSRQVKRWFLCLVWAIPYGIQHHTDVQIPINYSVIRHVVESWFYEYIRYHRISYNSISEWNCHNALQRKSKMSIFFLSVFARSKPKLFQFKTREKCWFLVLFHIINSIILYWLLCFTSVYVLEHTRKSVNKKKSPFTSKQKTCNFNKFLCRSAYVRFYLFNSFQTFCEKK